MVGDRRLYSDDRTCQERLNAQRGDNPPSLNSSPPWEGDFENIDLITYLKDDYAEPEFRILYQEETDSPHYAIAKGSLYEKARESPHTTASDGLDVSRMLSQGKVEEAEQKVEEMLE